MTLRRTARNILLLICCGLLAGCGRREYDQSTPDAVIYSLTAMIENGDVGRIPELVKADDENTQLLLARTGDLLRRVHALSITVREKYPDEVADLLETATEEGARLADEQGRQRGRSDWEDRFLTMVADPFATMREEMLLVEAVPVADDMYAITYDDKPIFGVGLILELDDDGKWYIAWPENIPGLRTAMPQTEQEWQIMHSIFQIVANGVSFAEEAIANDEVKSLDECTREIMEQVAPNLFFSWMLYEQAVDNRPESASTDPETKPADDATSESDG
ncbi:MAG: hypothetical protein ACF8PN_14605 [Phycisphaerales bacterium]